MTPGLRFAVAVPVLGLLGSAFVLGLFGASSSVTQSGTTTLTPPIVQPGPDVARPDQARLSGSVQFAPARKGRPVVIQRMAPGGPWTDVTTLHQNAAGAAAFTGAAFTSSDEAYTYRGVASRWKGLAKVTSTSQSADAWTSSFVDEFDGTSLSDQWQDRESDSPSRKCSRVGDPRARNVSGGTLQLSVMVDPDRVGSKCHSSDGRFKYYLNGQVSTAGSFAGTRGFYAARIKFAQKRGQHGSFWMQPVAKQYLEGNPSASGAEIDVVEFFGKGYPKGGLASFVYNYGVNGGETKIGGMAPQATKALPSGDAWWKRYHVFSVEWTKNKYVFRVDGKEHFRTTRGVSGVDEYPILSMLSSDWELAQAKTRGIEPGGSMKVDWVQVWQQ